MYHHPSARLWRRAPRAEPSSAGLVAGPRSTDSVRGRTNAPVTRLGHTNHTDHGEPQLTTS
eukprot:2772814-Prymnesium_polylepis.1